MLQINSPYPYQQFKRTSVNGKRLYQNPWGDPVPSVTTILSDTQPAEKRAGLAAWRRRVGDEEARRITTEAANVGSVMHNILEHWVKNEEFNPGNNIVHKQAKQMAEVIKENIQHDLDEVWGSEVNLVAKELYAGTTDLVGVYKGRPTIMDFKQTNKPKRREWIDDYFLQGAAYANAHNEMYGTTIDRIAIFMCSRACKWQLFECGPDEFSEYELKWAERLEKFYNLS